IARRRGLVRDPRGGRQLMRKSLIIPLALLGCATQTASRAVPENPAEPHLRNVRQITFGGENAEAYWSWDGTKLVLQASGRRGFQCDQILVMDADGSNEQLVSTGLGRTTCS